MLVLNALIFRIPYTIWKFSEGGLLKQFCPEEARNSSSAQDLATLTKTQAENFKENKDDYLKYYAIFQTTQLLNVAMTIINFYINNVFLFGLYFGYGFEWMKYDSEDPEAPNPRCNLFPTSVK